MNDEKVIQTKIESWIAAVILTVIFSGIAIFCKKWWNGLTEEQQEKFRKGCIKDLRIGCIITLFIVIILIETDSFE